MHTLCWRGRAAHPNRPVSTSKGRATHMAELRRLAKTCNFGSYLEPALRDQLVCGLKDPRIQRELLCVQKLTVAQGLERARAMEAVAKEAKHLQLEGGDTETDEAPTHQVRRAEKPHCHRCGSTDHMAAKCAQKDKRCHKCHKIGHLARVCKSSRTRVATRSRKTHVLEADRESTGSGDESDELGTTLAGIHKVAQGGSKYQKLITTLKVEGKNNDFEVDTGAELSTIPAALYRAKLKQVWLEPSSVILRQYDGTALPTMGEIVVGASHGQQHVKGRFIIVEKVDKQLPLLGRDWLYRLRLDWPKMLNKGDDGDPRVHTLHSATWINEFPEVTKDGLGLLRGIKADVELEEGAEARFCRCRPVPFALRDQVGETIQKQVEDGQEEGRGHKDMC